MDTYWVSVKQFFNFLVIFFYVNNVVLVTPQTGAGTLYRGKYIGRLQARQHKVSGEVYAVDARTLHIRDFTYDGTGPDAFFWTGFTEHPSPQGIIVPDEKGSKAVLGAYNAQDISITLPDGLTLKDVKWFSIWCRAYEVNFGDLYLPADLDYPQPHVIGSLSGQHGVTSGPIVVVDAQTILVPDFTYDGQAPDVHFWVGRGKPGPEGVRVPDETGGDTPLVKSDKKTMVLTLPGDLTIFDIDFFAVWCRLYYVDFGHVKILPSLNVPPSLRMLGVTPQTKLNCEVLWDDLALEIRWAVAGESIVMQLVGKVEDKQYMSFGLSGEDSRSVMIGGDVVVGWFDKAGGRGHVVDYYLDGKSQCSGRRGTCPDSRLQAEANNVRLLSATVVNDYTMLTFQRVLAAHDELDKPILTNGSQSVIWAVGPVNERDEASYHTLRNRDDLFIDFGRVPKWNCPAPESELTRPTTASLQASNNLTSNTPGVVVQLTPEPRPVEVGLAISTTTTTSRPTPQPQPKPTSSLAWDVPPILCHEPEDRVFYAQMGTTGGKRGYTAITGHTGWGIAWQLNGLLIPEVHVVRGRTYTFVVEGGDNPEIPARYHPFYITDDPEGGYEYKTQAEKNRVKVFAGVGIDSQGKNIPTATGRLCQWTEHSDQPADSFASYGAYQRSLSLHCDEGHPGILHWTPDENTPDTVYYQCYTHRYLGWKIRVLDSCEGDQAVESSENVPPPQGPSSAPTRDQELGESIVHDTRIPLIPKLFNDLKASAVNKMGPTGSPSSQPSPFFPVDVPASNSKLTDSETTSFDKSLLNEKQEPAGIIYKTQSPGPISLHKQEYQRPPPPESAHYSAQNVFIHSGGPEEGVHSPGVPQQQHVLYSHPPPPSYASLPYPAPDDTRSHVVRNSHPFKFVDAYGQPVRVGEGSRIFYETQSGSDYVVGPTRTPMVAHPVRYEIVASTIPPQQILGNPGYESSRNKAEYVSVQSRGPEAGPLLQGAVVRLKDVRLRPEQIALSSETVKFIDYPPPHIRVSGGNEQVGFRARPSWPHSRNLPKREEFRADGGQQFPSLDELRMTLKSLDDNPGEDSPFEIVKVNDTNLLPFELPLNLTEQVEQEQPKSSTPYGDMGHGAGSPPWKQSGIVPRMKSTLENSSPPKLYIVDDSNHAMRDESMKQSMARNTHLSQRLLRGGQITKQEYAASPHGSRYRAYQNFKRQPTSNFNVHDMERVSESKDLMPEANQRTPPSILSLPGGNNMRPPILRVPQPPPGTVVAFDGRHVSLNNGGINFRPSSDGLTPSIQNKPQFVAYRGELPGSILEIPQNFPHLNSQNSQNSRHPGFRNVLKAGDIQALPSDRLYTSVQPQNQNENHNLIPTRNALRPASKLEIVPNDDITMVYIKGADDRELQRELPKISSQVQKESQGETQRRRTEFEGSDSLESPSITAESEETIQILHAYNNPTKFQQQKTQPRQEVPQNNTDLHILTDIWSIINNQDESSVSKIHFPQVSYRPINPQRSGLPFITRPLPALQGPQRRT